MDAFLQNLNADRLLSFEIIGRLPRRALSLRHGKQLQQSERARAFLADKRTKLASPHTRHDFQRCPAASLLCGFPVSASMQYFQAEQPRTLTLPTQIRMSSQQDASGDRLDCFWHFMMGTNNARSYCEKLLP